MRIGARRRLDIFLDENDSTEIAQDVEAIDRLKFRDVKKYKDRLLDAQKKTGEKDALIAMSGHLKGIPVVSCAFEFRFSRRLYGLCSWREVYPGRQFGPRRATPLYLFLCNWRSAHARGANLADANGQNQCRS
jgi:hypothetical protein